MMQLHGLHHLTAVSADAKGNHAFYTGVMGLQLVKRTVNQDDTGAYHLFYADALASPGSDITFFEWPVAPERRGTNAVVRTALRVAGEASLAYWADRLRAAGGPVGPVREADGRLELEFEDPEGQRLALVEDGGAGLAYPWAPSPVPEAHQVRGLGPVTLSVAQPARSEAFLTEVMAMRRDRGYTAPDGTMTQVYAMGEGGPAAELHLRAEPGLAPAKEGAGGVHHVAFRVRDEAEYAAWVERYRRLGVRSSGPVDRFYFQSLYAREPGSILFEIATDGPGFATDEAADALGQRLSLPPFLERRRAAIERGLKPL